jgi:hypothetical protein
MHITQFKLKVIMSLKYIKHSIEFLTLFLVYLLQFAQIIFLLLVHEFPYSGNMSQSGHQAWHFIPSISPITYISIASLSVECHDFFAKRSFSCGKVASWMSSVEFFAYSKKNGVGRQSAEKLIFTPFWCSITMP